MITKYKEDLISLIKVTNSIKKIYMNLAELEIRNKIESNDWRLQLEYLELCKEYENKLYKKIPITVDNVTLFSKYVQGLTLREQLFEKEHLDDISKYEPVCRITRKFEKKIFDTLFTPYTKEGFPSTEELISYYTLEDGIVKSNLSHDYNTYFLVFLEEEIKSEKNKKIKEPLIIEKYLTLFTEGLDQLLSHKLILEDRKNKLLFFGHDHYIVDGTYSLFNQDLIRDSMESLISSYDEDTHIREYRLHLDIADLKTGLTLDNDTNFADMYKEQYIDYFIGMEDKEISDINLLKRIDILETILEEAPQTKEMIQKKVLRREDF